MENITELPKWKGYYNAKAYQLQALNEIQIDSLIEEYHSW